MSTKKSNPTPQRAKKKSPPTLREIALRKLKAELPTPAALAEIVSRLATRYPMGSAIGYETAKALAEEALRIWTSCERLLNEVYSARCEGWDEMQMEGPEFVDDYEAWDRMHAAVPPAKKYPISLSQFLRLAGGRSEADRLHLYRRFLTEFWHSDSHAEEAIKRDRDEGFDEHEHRPQGVRFLKWLKEYRERAKHARASAGGKALSEKRRMNQEKIS
jgi:hypothetical protein